MTSPAQRAFEIWANTQDHNLAPDIARGKDKRDYLSAVTTFAWDAWQAALASRGDKSQQLLETIESQKQTHDALIKKLIATEAMNDKLAEALEHGLKSVEYLFKDFKMRIDIGNCDGYKDDDGYVFPVGTSVVMGLDKFITDSKQALTAYEQER